MTARWSGVFLDSQRQRCVSEEDLEGERQRVSAGARRAVSEDGVLLRVLVTRNVSCRNELEASRQCARGMP
jgi:hypothetical protein